jgi:hypothetical protein
MIFEVVANEELHFLIMLVAGGENSGAENAVPYQQAMNRHDFCNGFWSNYEIFS